MNYLGWKTILKDLEKEKLKILENQIEWQSVQQEIDGFLAWCLASRDSYAVSIYKEKRRALRVLGLTVTIYRRNDDEHDRYQINAKLLDVLTKSSE